MSELITVTLLAVGILQIILFFKLWIMTNDIGRIKKLLIGDKTHKEIRKTILRGDKIEIKAMYTELLINDLLNVDLDFNQVIEEYKKYFEKIGEEIPDNILNIKSRSEIDGL